MITIPPVGSMKDVLDFVFTFIIPITTKLKSIVIQHALILEVEDENAGDEDVSTTYSGGKHMRNSVTVVKTKLNAEVFCLSTVLCVILNFEFCSTSNDSNLSAFGKDHHKLIHSLRKALDGIF